VSEPVPTIKTGLPPQLSHAQLLEAQDQTLATARRHYTLAARGLFRLLDVIYGRERSLGKFKILEIIARVPYQAWEHVAYIAATNVHEQLGLVKRIHERVIEARAQQDNELWHLLILENYLRSRARHSPG